MTTQRRCAGTNKAGQPCAAPPLRPGTVIDGTTVAGAHCRTHDPDLPASARIQGPQPGGGRPRKPRAVDILREHAEAHAADVLRVVTEGMAAERSVVVGSGDCAHIETVPDHPTRLAAVRELLDRAYGRPTQATEISGPDGGPVQVLDATSEAGRRALRDVLASRAHPSDG